MNDDLHYDKDGIDLTEDAEGCILHAYPDPGTGGAPWTIGYGHTGAEVHAGLVWTHEQAEQALRADIHNAELEVKAFVKVKLTQGQYDALVDFDFNKGGKNLRNSTLLKLVNEGEFKAADNEFQKWVMGGGHVLPGLVKRAHAEAQIFAA